MLNNNQIWQAVLGEIELSLSRANFTTWFQYTFIISFQDNKLVIGVPNGFTKTWLENKFHKPICQAIENITGQKIKEIFYKIETKKPTDNNVAQSNKQTDQQIDQQQTKKQPILKNRFNLNNYYTFDNFIVGRSNDLAHAACQAVAANPGMAYNPLFIYGGVGLGKTHLLHAVGHQSSKTNKKILYTSSEQFTNDYVHAVRCGDIENFKNKYRSVDILLIDDIQFMCGKDGTQEQFFHTFNELHQSNRQIIITCDTPPKTIPAMEKRLLSRLEWGMVVDIVQPNTETKIAILKKKCEEKNFFLEETILNYIADNTINIRELEGALNRIIAFSELNNSNPILDTVKNILNDFFISIHTKSITPKNILEAVSKFYDISIKDLISDKRHKELVWARHIAIYIIKKELNTSYPTIGQEIGGRDHTTAMYSYNKIYDEIHKNKNIKLKQEVESIKQFLHYNINQ